MAVRRPNPVRFVPVEVDSPQDRFAKALATELAIEGLDDCGALPIAIGILGCVQAAIEAGDLDAGIAEMRAGRASSDRWWVRNHPRGKMAARARVRLGID